MTISMALILRSRVLPMICCLLVKRPIDSFRHCFCDGFARLNEALGAILIVEGFAAGNLELFPSCIRRGRFVIPLVRIRHNTAPWIIPASGAGDCFVVTKRAGVIGMRRNGIVKSWGYAEKAPRGVKRKHQTLTTSAIAALRRSLTVLYLRGHCAGALRPWVADLGFTQSGGASPQTTPPLLRLLLETAGRNPRSDRVSRYSGEPHEEFPENLWKSVQAFALLRSQGRKRRRSR